MKTRTIKLSYRLWSYPGTMFIRWYFTKKAAEKASERISGRMWTAISGTM